MQSTISDSAFTKENTVISTPKLEPVATQPMEKSITKHRITGTTVITFTWGHHDRMFSFFRIGKDDITLADICTGITSDTFFIILDQWCGTAWDHFNALMSISISLVLVDKLFRCDIL